MLITQVQLTIFILGGCKRVTSDELFEDVTKLKKIDICGVMFGRNIWQNTNIDTTIDGVSRILKQQ